MLNGKLFFIKLLIIMHFFLKLFVMGKYIFINCCLKWAIFLFFLQIVIFNANHLLKNILLFIM